MSEASGPGLSGEVSADPPCEWPVPIPEGFNSALQALSPTDEARITRMAVELLWAWSGRRFGLCSVTVRPFRSRQVFRPSTFWDGGWVWADLLARTVGPRALRCGHCSGVCQCAENSATALTLPGPVEEVVEVWISGEVLPSTSYTLRDGVLLRTDGEAWPDLNDDLADPRDPLKAGAAWEIVYKQGYPVPPGGQHAAFLLAEELAKAATGDNTCALPRRVQTVTRQGVSVAVLDSFEDLDEGKTGIWEIDSWLSSVAFKRVSSPRVYSPDIPSGYLRGTSHGAGFGRSIR